MYSVRTIYTGITAGPLRLRPVFKSLGENDLVR